MGTSGKIFYDHACVYDTSDDISGSGRLVYSGCYASH